MTARAAHFESLPLEYVRCGLCPHACRIAPSALGRCRTRRNEAGTLEVTTYGLLEAVASDPVEKKPLFHYRPSTFTFSVASAGCNLECPFCQNHDLSQALRSCDPDRLRARPWTADQIVAAARREGCASISFTYSEPVLSFELARDVAALAAPLSLDVVFVTNGQAERAPAEELGAFLAAANVDLKCFSAKSYSDVLGGSLEAATRTIEILHGRGVWVEVTTLVVPGFNDSDEELAATARFIAGVDRDMPWHVSRFHPDHLWLDRGPTPPAALDRARELGRDEGLRYVYTGNLPGSDGEKTRCAACGAVVIDRHGYQVSLAGLKKGRCAACGERIAGKGLT
ncbi:MAG: AmmeMemoRadiSam system radical SAM enzyme [Deltaproteobacteria bacterium]|nr:AmmeMemoRadiSam system radical SAM enzyme [Deltaproteobacteria bacterium]